MPHIEPPKPSRGPSPLLTTVQQVEAILRKAAADDEGPLRLDEIKRRIHAKSIRHATIRGCVEELKRFHLVIEDPKKGVLWTLREDPAFWSRKDLQRI